MKSAAWLGIAVLWAAQAYGESQFGVTVYPSAKADAAVTRSLKEQIGVNGAAYRTSDGLSKVVEFYRKQPLKEEPGGSKESAAFTRSGGVMVTIQNPWMDMATGKMINDTLISIVKN